MLEPSRQDRSLIMPACSASIKAYGKEKPVSKTGVIGPNSVIQLRAALVEIVGEQDARAFFTRAGLDRFFIHPPQKMIDEAVPARLFNELFIAYPYRQARRIALLAGELTAEYILTHRIPQPVVSLLTLLPPDMAGAMLMRAISRNAWTFTGSGQFSYQTKPIKRIRIFDNPLRMPDCAWHVAVFQRLFSRLVCRESRVKYLQPVNQSHNEDHFVVCYGLHFFASYCRSAHKRKIRQFCCQCVATKSTADKLH